MSELEKLIKELCPNGVEYKPLGELGEFYGGITGKNKNDFVDGNAKFISYMNVYKNLKLNIDTPERVKISPNEKQRTLEYGDVIFTGSSETPDECGISSVLAYKTEEKLYLNSFCICYRFNDPSMFNPEFSKYLFRSRELRIQIGKTASGVTRFNVSKEKMKKVVIPIVPLEIQQEIVRILDNFTKLTAELTKELTARKKQYEHYRDMLLSFDDIRPADQADNGGGYNNNVIYRKLGEICEYGKERISAETLSVENYVSVENLLPNKQGKTAASRVPTGYVCIAYKRGDILIGNIRPYLKKIWLADCDGGTNGDVLVVQMKDKQAVQERFLYHCLSSEKFFNYDDSNAKGAKMPRGDKNAVMDFEIPVPPLETQKRIVSILDKFEMLANSLSDGLPAEIEARKKQYEYYRDKLLDFKDVGGGYYLLEKIVQWLPLGEIATITRGGNFQKKDFTSNGIPCIHYGQIYTKYGLYANETFTFISEEVAKKSKKATTNDIIMAVTSENIEDVCKCVAWLGKEDVAVSGHTAIIHHNQNAKYLAYYFHTQMFFAQKEKYAHGTKVIEVTPSKLADIIIPLPPLAIQGWIAEILDKFHSLATDISEGIPAEIEARKKQYEYYRDKLLAFKKIENVV
ncbi:MAG: restriction endonuclease subunit S [Treponemataceae bacterium]|nr:restriction endonuclease subunit S [Treponemataceae bacterium]